MPSGSLTVTPPTAAAPVVAARELADDLLRPQAESVDQDVVPRSHLDAIAAAGLLGVTAPVDLGGGGHPAPVGRAVVEELAAGCGATWFVMAQHGLPQLAVARAGHRRAADLAAGRVLAGVAVSHLRRPGPPAVTATRTPGGWRFDGHVGWMTSWGICDVFLLAGVAGDQLVTALLDAREQPGLTASEPLRLAAMTATRTVTLDLDGLRVADADVVDVVPLQPWLEVDRQKTANPGAHTVGLQRECTRRLAARDGTAQALAVQLAAQGDELRDASYALVDGVPAAERVEDRLALRAAGLDLAVRSATALVAATGGSAMDLAQPAQRLLREAVFHVVQAQTGPVREATLRHWMRAEP